MPKTQGKRRLRLERLLLAETYRLSKKPAHYMNRLSSIDERSLRFGVTPHSQEVACNSSVDHHLATFTLNVTVLSPPLFLMTNLYCPSFFGVTLTEHFGPGESSLATSAPEES